MKIYDQIKNVLEGQRGGKFATSRIKQLVSEKFGANETSVIPSDYCYNRINNGIAFNQHLFVRLSPGEYKYVGESFPYTGWIYQKPRLSKKEEVAGRWENGSYELVEHEQPVPDEQNAKPSSLISSLQLDQIEKLYEEYLSLLKLEVDIFGCKPTETRHLIGRIGEFKAALETQGTLAKRVNQAGFDVISHDGRKISVKTTAQKAEFVSFNKNTTHLVDDLMVIQYREKDFIVVFHDSIDVAINHSQIYKDRYEFDIGKAKAL